MHVDQLFASATQQLTVEYGLCEPYHAVVLRDQTPQYALAHGTIILRRKHKSYLYVSRLLQQHTNLSEVSLILRFLYTFLEFHTKLYICHH